MRKLFCFFLFLIIGYFASANANIKNESFYLEVPIDKNLEPYIDTMLLNPAYFALALNNIGSPLSLSQPLKLLSRDSIKLGPGVLNFIKKKNLVYHYSANIILAFDKGIVVPVEIELSDIDNSVIKIRVIHPLIELIPQDILVKVESKLQMLANPSVQKKLFEYLAKQSGGKLTNDFSISRLLDSIAFDAFNQSGRLVAVRDTNNKHEVGTAEPLSDQMLFILAVIIWLLGFPLFLFFIRRQRARLIVPKNIE